MEELTVYIIRNKGPQRTYEQSLFLLLIKTMKNKVI